MRKIITGVLITLALAASASVAQARPCSPTFCVPPPPCCGH